MRFELINENGEKKIFNFPNNQKIIVGRSKKCEISVDGEGISRQHLEIEVKNGKAYVVDQGSVNGSFINEERMNAKKSIEFTTFFPVRLGFATYLHLVAIEEEDVFGLEAAPKKKSFNEDFTSTSTKKVTRPPAKKGKNRDDDDDMEVPSLLGSFTAKAILGVLVVGFASWYFFAPTDDAPSATEQEAKSAGISNEDLMKSTVLKEQQILSEYLDGPKCETVQEKRVCERFGRPLERREGVLLTNTALLIFVNAKYGLENHYKELFKNVPKETQENVVLLYEGMNEDRVVMARSFGVPSIIVVNFDLVSEAPMMRSTLKVPLDVLGTYPIDSLRSMFFAFINGGTSKVFDQSVKQAFPLVPVISK